MLGRKRNVWVRASERGMTLVEIMIVVAIIGMVVGGVGLVAINQFEKAKVQQAKRDVQQIKGGAEVYMAQNVGSPPPASVEELAKNKIVKVTNDPWGSPYQLKCPGEHDSDSCDVWSSGKDRKAQTQDDINSW